jgi:hypothetical protein
MSRLVTLTVALLCMLATLDGFRVSMSSRRVQSASKSPASFVRPSGSSLYMSDDATEVPEASVETKSKKGEIDVSQYTVGQQFKGKVVSVKQFGIFAEIENTKNTVLLPKSLLTRGTYSKLSDAASKKSTDLINFEIHNVNNENKTLSAKYIPEGGLLDFSTIKKEDLKSKEFAATVVGTHDFGIFVELDQ